MVHYWTRCEQQLEFLHTHLWVEKKLSMRSTKIILGGRRRGNNV